MNKKYRDAEFHFRERRSAFKREASQCTKMYRELHDLTVSKLELETNIPVVENRLAIMKAALPKTLERIELLTRSWNRKRKSRKHAEERLTLANRKFALTKRLLELDKEINRLQ